MRKPNRRCPHCDKSLCENCREKCCETARLKTRLREDKALKVQAYDLFVWMASEQISLVPSFSVRPGRSGPHWLAGQNKLGANGHQSFATGDSPMEALYNLRIGKYS